jgi:hypothetical protein
MNNEIESRVYIQVTRVTRVTRVVDSDDVEEVRFREVEGSAKTFQAISAPPPILNYLGKKLIDADRPSRLIFG